MPRTSIERSCRERALNALDAITEAQGATRVFRDNERVRQLTRKLVDDTSDGRFQPDAWVDSSSYVEHTHAHAFDAMIDANVPTYVLASYARLLARVLRLTTT